MLGRVPTICVLILLSLAGLSLLESNAFGQAVSSSHAQPVATKAVHEIVLLDNGRVLQGQVTRTADQVHILTHQGSRIVLSSKRIDAILDSMEDVWQHRSSKLAADDVQGHLSLFHWCLKHHLQHQAQQQLTHLMLADLDVNRLKYLDQQIARTFERPAEQHRDASNTERTNKLSDDSYAFKSLPPLDADNRMPTKTIVDRAIALASHTEPADNDEVERLKTARGKTVPKVPQQSIRDELDSMTDLLTRDDLHQFQRRIQPVLLKGCLAAKCHSSNATVMPLMHRGHGQLVPKRFTQRNLQSMMPWIDGNDASNSGLLTQATVAHGGQETPAMQLDSPEFQRLSAWVEAIVENSPELISGAGGSGRGIRVADAKDAGGARLSRSATAVDVSPPAPTRANKAGRSSVDPFDPAAFNQLPR